MGEWKCGCLRFQERTVAEVHDRRSRILYQLALSELVGPNATPLHFGWWLRFFAFHLLWAAATRNANVPAVWVVVTLLSLITFHLSRGSDLGGHALPRITTHHSLLAPRLPGLRDFQFL